MTLDNWMKILLAAGSLTAGAFLTALRAKLANTRKKNWLHIIFYAVSGIVFISTIISIFVYWSEFIKPDWFLITVSVIALCSSLALMWVTYKFLTGKYQFTTTQLDPVVNAFSLNADKGNIKLLAGSLDFLGQSVQQIDAHPQYVCLRGIPFRQIQILCTSPVTIEDKVRYGKILTDMPTAELRYYKPTAADLKVRGRIKTLNNVTRLLIYSKVDGQKFEALELDTADTDGALYSHLWNLIWEIADKPSLDQLNEYRNFYRPSIQQV